MMNKTLKFFKKIIFQKFPLKKNRQTIKLGTIHLTCQVQFYALLQTQPKK